MIRRSMALGTYFLFSTRLAQAFWIPEEALLEDGVTTRDFERKANCLEPGIIYHGHNLEDTASRTARDVRECQEECDADVDCRAFTFTPVGCFLKDREYNTGKRGSSSVPGVVSWVKSCAECLEVGVHYTGSEVPLDESLAAGSASECYAQCASNDLCATFTFGDERGCVLLGDDAEESRDEVPGSTLMSWTKTCASNEMTDENMATVMERAVVETEERSEKFADEIEGIMEQCEVKIQSLGGVMVAEDVDTRLGRLAETVEDIPDVLPATFGDEELVEEEDSCKYDEDGNRLTVLEGMRQAIRSKRVSEELGGGSSFRGNAVVESEEEDEFDEYEYRDVDTTFDDHTAAELQSAGCLEAGVRFFGGDLEGEIKDAKTPRQCEIACQNEDLCYHFTFSDDEGCRLKDREASSKRRYTKKVTDVSGSKACSSCSEAGVRYPGGNLTASPLAKVNTAPECLRLCQAAPECKVFTFVHGVGCFLKTGEAINARVFSGSIEDVSWKKECGNSIEMCKDDEFVRDHRCEKCPHGSGNYAGDDPSGDDTECDKCTQIGLRFVGNDLTDEPNAAPSAAACQAACQAEADCHHMTFTSEGQCFLKNADAVSSQDHTGHEDDISWSKTCVPEPLSVEEFKMLVLKEGGQFVEEMKETRLVKMAEIVEQEKLGSFEKLIASDDDDDVAVVIDSLSKAADEIKEDRRRRNLQPRPPSSYEWGAWTHEVVNGSQTKSRVRDVHPSQGRRPATPQSSSSGRPRTTSSSRGSPQTRAQIRNFFGVDENHFVEFLSNVDSGDAVNLFGAITGTNSGIIGDIANTVQIIQPLIASAATSNREVAMRQLLEAKMAVLKALPLPPPIQLLFQFAYHMVDVTNGHYGNRAIDWDEMRRVIGPLTVVAIFETIGNPHLKSLRKIYQMVTRVGAAGDLKVLNVNDVLAMITITLRAVGLASPFFPVIQVPVNIALIGLKLIADSGFLDTRENNAALNQVLGFIQGPKGGLIHRLIQFKHKIVVALTKIVDGFVVALFGGNRRRIPEKDGHVHLVQAGGDIVGGVIVGIADTITGTVNGIGKALTGGGRKKSRRRGYRGRTRKNRNPVRRTRNWQGIRGRE